MHPDFSKDTLQNTLRWFQLARPVPDDASFHTQLGVHFEEVREMLDEISPLDPVTSQMLHDTRNQLEQLSRHLKGATGKVTVHEFDRVNYLDALCDQIVTATGCAHDQACNLIGAMTEVNRGNWSKFVDGKPVFNEHGKIAKGPNYLKPELDIFV